MRFRAPMLAIAVLVTLGTAGRADAATVVFGSDLSAVATRAFPSPYDIAFWSPQLPNGSSTRAPADGQILELRLKGCAERSRSDPPGSPMYKEPYTESHFQDLKPQADGTLRVNVTTNPFFTPICGDPGVDQNYVSTFTPINFCVSQGDYVDWNDSGGFDGVATNYPQGVYYDFFAPSPAARTLFFRAPDKTNNGDTLTPAAATEDPLGQTAAAPLYPYTFNYAGTGSQNLELLMSVTLGTGADATPLCPGGTKGVAPAPPPKPVPGPARPRVVLHPQTDGVNHRRRTAVHLFCSGAGVHCAGIVSLTLPGSGATLGTARFDGAGGKTAKVVVRVTANTLRLLRAHNRRLGVTMTVVLDRGGSANTTTRSITLEF